ncbi:MAG: helix-turn-helix domain-containing protein [Halanaeroarchaeum sp.]
MMAPLGVYTHVLGAIEASGFSYVLYRYREEFREHPFLVLPVFGLLVFVSIEVVHDYLPPSVVHAGHALAAGTIAMGLSAILLQWNRAGHDMGPFPRATRPTWMTKMDDDILSLLDSANLVLTPAVIAYNLGYSRKSVNRHLRKLERHDLVTRVDRGKYRVSEEGSIAAPVPDIHSLSRMVVPVVHRIERSVARAHDIWLDTDQRSGR